MRTETLDPLLTPEQLRKLKKVLEKPVRTVPACVTARDTHDEGWSYSRGGVTHVWTDRCETHTNELLSLQTESEIV